MFCSRSLFSLPSKHNTTNIRSDMNRYIGSGVNIINAGCNLTERIEVEDGRVDCMFVRMRGGEGGGRLCDWVAPARIDRCVTSQVNSGVANR